MSKRFIHVTALILVLMTVFSIPVAAAAASVPSPAQPQSDAYIAGYYATLESYSTGTVTVAFSTTGTSLMDTVGATSIVIYKWNSIHPVGSLYSSYTASMLGHYRISYGNSYTFSVTPGEKYYAVVSCYATKDGGSSTRKYTTSYCTAKK